MACLHILNPLIISLFQVNIFINEMDQQFLLAVFIADTLIIVTYTAF